MPSVHVSATFLAVFHSKMQSVFFLHSKGGHSQTYISGHILKHIQMLVFVVFKSRKCFTLEVYSRQDKAPFKHTGIAMLYFTKTDSNSSKPPIKITGTAAAAAAAAAYAKNYS
jgi:hypothetical protein